MIPALPRNRRLPLLALIALLALAVWALAPGLRGGFVFDDYVNLDALGDYGRVDNGAVLARYLTSGAGDPTGRPLALLSFLADAREWPADPYPFKLTNLLLHLLNGVLLFGGLRALGRAFGIPPPRRDWTAMLGSGLWLLHPLFVSTTFYVVQREAMLPATFTLAALWIWLRARARLLDGGGTRMALVWMTLAVVLGTALASASKANGVLLPALLLSVECCLPRAPAPPSLRRARLWLLMIPSVLVLLALLAAIPGAVSGAAANRGWSLGQRLLTEPRVLWDYLGLLWLPHPYTRGLFNDSFVASQSLWQPWTTAPAMLAMLGLIAWACWQRRRHPALALAVLFYVVGQSIESGPVALELYFEHRNYVPAMLMFWPLALWLTDTGSLRRIRHGLAVLLPLGLAGMTHMNASLWGNPAEQALVWAQKNPDSPRAQAYAAQFELQLGQPARAEARLGAALAKRPLEPQLVVNYAGARCANGGLRPSDIDLLGASLRTDPDPGRLGGKWLTDAVPLAFDGGCPGLGPQQLRDLLAAFAANPRTPLVYGRRVDVAQLSGRIALREGHAEEALQDFRQALAADPRPDVVLVQTAMLASAGEYERALQLLPMAQTMGPKPWYRWRKMGDVHQWVLDRQGYWRSQIAELRGKIQADLRAKETTPQ